MLSIALLEQNGTQRDLVFIFTLIGGLKSKIQLSQVQL